MTTDSARALRTAFITGIALLLIPGTTAANHYGHKNVIFRADAEGQVPTRPIYARAPGTVNRSASAAERLAMPFLDFADRQRVFDFNKLTDTVYSTPECPEGLDVRELPEDCREGAATPRELFTKLDQWGFDTMVIPHGNAWGLYTPPGTTWDKQLKNGNQRSNYQFMIELFSGHGNSEEYRDWRAVEVDAQGNTSCPQPREDYTPSCWRAGEIIASRCLDEGGTTAECESRASRARQLYADNGVAGHNAVGGVDFEEWLNSGQCRDCFLPAFNYRPGGSAQYALSLTSFDQPGDPQRFNFALIGSSDNHVARPGTGYKEYDRYGMTETSGVQEAFARKVAYPQSEYSALPREGDFLKLPPVKKFEHERSSSFFYTGGLVAVHSSGRDRDSLWDAMQDKQVYGTSGERFLLWFDLLNGNEGRRPMGSELAMSHTPRFRVSALGAFRQKPGCPDYVRGDRPNWHMPGAFLLLEPTDEAGAGIVAADHIHWGGIGLLFNFDGEVAAGILEEARARGAVVTADLIAPGDHTPDCVKAAAPHLDWFMPSVDEALDISGTDTVEAAAQFFMEQGAGGCVIKCGAKGAYIADQQGLEQRIPVIRDVEVVDTSGCGDSFCGGFNVGLANGFDPVQACHFAAATAAQVATGVGSDAGVLDFATTEKIMNAGTMAVLQENG